jgi:hypothetical protein
MQAQTTAIVYLQWSSTKAQTERRIHTRTATRVEPLQYEKPSQVPCDESVTPSTFLQTVTCLVLAPSHHRAKTNNGPPQLAMLQQMERADG